MLEGGWLPKPMEILEGTASDWVVQKAPQSRGGEGITSGHVSV